MGRLGYGFGPSRRRRLAAAPVAPSVTTGFTWRMHGDGQGTTTDNAALTTLTALDAGSPVSLAKVSTPAAVYKANIANGKGAIRFMPGGQGNSFATVYSVDRALNASMIAAIDGRSYTMHFVVSNTGTGQAILCSQTTTLNHIKMSSLADTLGLVDTSVGNLLMSLGDTGLHVVTFVVSQTGIPGAASAGRTMCYIDGALVGMTLSYTQPTGGLTPLIGALNAAGASGTKVDLLDWYVYPTPLTHVQIRRDHAVLRAIYGGSALATKHILMIGSSLGMGTGTTTQTYTVGNQIAVQLGLPHGQVWNLCAGGTSWGTNTSVGVRYSVANDVAPLVAELGAANIMVIAWEGYNTLLARTAAQAATDARDCMLELVALGISPANIVLADVTGVSTARGNFANYPAYAAAIAAIPSANPSLASLQIAALSADPGNHVGLAPTASTQGGYVGNTASGSNGAGANSDGANGAYSSNTVGSGGDGVHRSGKAGYVAGGSGIASAYPYITDNWFRVPAAAFLA